MLVGLSVLVALVLTGVSYYGMTVVKDQVDDLIRATNVERNTYKTILEEKNYLLNANGSITNHAAAQQAFDNAEAALQTIYMTLSEMDSVTNSVEVRAISRAAREATDEYRELYKRGVYLLNELATESRTLQVEGEFITRQIQEYVEAKRVEVKRELSQKTIEKINCGSNIWQYTYVTRADEKRYLLTPDDALYEKLKKDFAFMMSEHTRLVSMSDQPFEHEKLALLYDSAKKYEQAMGNWVKHNNELVTTVLPQTKVLGDAVIAQAVQVANDAVDDMIRKRQTLLVIVIVVTLATVILGLLFGTLISRSISSVIGSFQEGLLDFFKYLDRRKNSASQIPIESNDEIAMMANVVNENIVKIEEVMEMKLRQMQEKDDQMLRQSRLAQMGEMISMIAHQWRQPLGAIASTVADIEIKLFQRRMYDLNTRQGQQEAQSYATEHLQKINSYVQHLSKTIDDFRNFFKPDKLQSTFTLDALMQKTLSLSSHLLRTRDITVQTDYDISVPPLTSFESEISQVLLNIIQNAVEALEEQKTEHPKITIMTGKTRSGNPFISIEDNAGGIPEAYIDKVFDPYFSTKEKNGTGLGLYMSQTIIEEHCDGIIGVQNTDKGARFTIEFKSGERG
jgi:signal transduction histidine kinase